MIDRLRLHLTFSSSLNEELLGKADDSPIASPPHLLQLPLEGVQLPHVADEAVRDDHAPLQPVALRILLEDVQQGVPHRSRVVVDRRGHLWTATTPLVSPKTVARRMRSHSIAALVNRGMAILLN